MEEGYFKNDFTKMWMKDGIVYTEYTPNLNITLAMAKVAVIERVKFMNGVSRPIFADVRNALSIDKEARDYLSSKEGTQYLSAGGFLVSSQVEKIMGTFFIKINRPIIPTKLFTNYEEAVKWLGTFRNTNATPA
ncbi:MAG TPA: hypothetical protein VF691_10330 [Cytophagaceae bacterium]|jgi:hypothetical protein